MNVVKHVLGFARHSPAVVSASQLVTYVQASPANMWIHEVAEKVVESGLRSGRDVYHDKQKEQNSAHPASRWIVRDTLGLTEESSGLLRQHFKALDAPTVVVMFRNNNCIHRSARMLVEPETRGQKYRDLMEFDAEQIVFASIFHDMAHSLHKDVLCIWPAEAGVIQDVARKPLESDEFVDFVVNQPSVLTKLREKLRHHLKSMMDEETAIRADADTEEVVLERFRGRVGKIANDTAYVTLVDAKGQKSYMTCRASELLGEGITEGSSFTYEVLKRKSETVLRIVPIPKKDVGGKRWAELLEEARQDIGDFNMDDDE